MAGRLRISVLGPIRAVGADGRDLTPAGELQRRLLALLVLHRGHVVSTDAAIEALWPTEPPRDPPGALQNHLLRLRSGLAAGLVQTSAGGYRLDAAAVDVDADHLDDLLAAASPADADVDALDDLLDRWRGPAYPELDGDDARAEASRLDELRTAAREVRAAARLARGDTDGLVAELSSLARDEPLRERPHELLMDALAATGRHAEALRTYDGFRRRLGDELGIEPSPALAARHAMLLQGGPAQSSHPAPAPAPVPRTRLPRPASSLVGRDDMVAELAARLDTTRLLTLVGPGGVGKTRLLLEVGHRADAARPDRPVVLCELAGADEATASTAVAGCLGVDAKPGVPLADQVAGVLGDAPLVLLVDNCEHVLGPVAELLDHLLVRCAELRVLATSRERLRVPGEVVCRVPVLPADGADSPAARLFLERARAAREDFAPADDDVATVLQVVRHLDGLPLAIELAAARLFTHDLADVAAGLDHRFSLLSSGYRTSERHGSLGAAVAWSVDLLDPGLRRVFAALSCFAGPFTAADAAAVCGLRDHEAAEALAQLAERSLVTRPAAQRYSMLESLRAFGAEQLAAAGARDDVHDRHARHLLARLERADRDLLVPGPGAIHAIEASLPELHLALGWLLGRGDTASAARLVVALLDFGIFRLRPDVLLWADRVTAADPAGEEPASALVSVVGAYAAWLLGDMAGSGALTERALRLASRHGAGLPAEVALARGNIDLFAGRLDAASDWYRRAVVAAADAGDLAQQTFAQATEVLALGYGDRDDTATASESLLALVGDAETGYAAYAWFCAGEAELSRNPGSARRRLERAVDLGERTGSSFVIGVAGASKASIDARFGDPQLAARDYRQLIAHWRRAGVWSTQWTMLRAIASLLDRLQRPRDAAVLVGAVRATASGHRIFGADEVALRDLQQRLQAALGPEGLQAALADGAALDGDAAVEHALRAL